MLEVGAQEDQAAGAALALGGGDAGLGALDLAFEGVFPEALARLPGVLFSAPSVPGAGPLGASGKVRQRRRTRTEILSRQGSADQPQAARAGGFLALLAFRLAGGAN